MRVLLTGSRGYIGSVMERELIRKGHDVAGLDTGYFTGDSADGRVGSGVIGSDGESHAGRGFVLAPDPERRSVLPRDIRDLAPPDIAGFDAVVHLAALSNDPMGDLKPEWTHQVNVEGSLHLARIARDAGVKRFLFASSCSVYGTSEQETATEDAPLRPLSPYAISKVKVEEGLDKLAGPGFSPVYLRNATAYGVSPAMRLDLVLNNLTAWAAATGRVRVVSDGLPWRPLVHVEDISCAFAAVLAAPRHVIHNQAFNVGSDDENHQVKTLAELVREIVPGAAICYSGENDRDPRTYRVKFAKIRAMLPEFQPVWTARLGVEELFASFQRAALTASDLESRRYIRLTQLRHLLAAGTLDESLRWRTVIPA